MHRFLLSLLLVQLNVCFAQETKDTSRLSLGVTSILFPSNEIYESGSFAIGPSFFLNDNKVHIQFGFLYDFKKYYIYYESALKTYEKNSLPHFLIPVLIHYEYYRTNSLSLHFSTGILYERRPSFYENESIVNFHIGTGVEFHLSRNISFKTTPSFNLSKGIISPGFLFDLLYSFNVIKEGVR